MPRTRFSENLMKTTLIRKLMAVLAVAVTSGHLTNANADESQVVRTKNMNLKLTVGEQVLTAALSDNPTSRDFVLLLPLTLTLKDYASTEKISDLPKRLSTQGAPEGSLPRAGDVTYYAPWGNLAVFHKDFKYSSGLIKIAHLNGDIAILSAHGPMTVQIELATPDRSSPLSTQ
jgi:hypothetical protein